MHQKKKVQSQYDGIKIRSTESQSKRQRETKARRCDLGHYRRERGQVERSQVQALKSSKAERMALWSGAKDRQQQQNWTSHKGKKESRVFARITTHQRTCLSILSYLVCSENLALQFLEKCHTCGSYHSLTSEDSAEGQCRAHSDTRGHPATLRTPLTRFWLY